MVELGREKVGTPAPPSHDEFVATYGCCNLTELATNDKACLGGLTIVPVAPRSRLRERWRHEVNRGARCSPRWSLGRPDAIGAAATAIDPSRRVAEFASVLPANAVWRCGGMLGREK